MEYPLVSIVTPCYNASKFIEETIKSVISQSYDNWEMLIVDDCSTDNSVEVINRYVKRDNRVKLYTTHVPSGSPSLPRNIAIEKARGAFIAFLDADDLWLPYKLERQVKFAVENSAAFVYSNTRTFKNISNLSNVSWLPDKVTYQTLLYWGCIPTLTAMIRRDLIGDIRFKSCPKEDYLFFLNILRTGVCALGTNNVLALYRIVESSRSSKKYDMIIQHYKLLVQHGCRPLVSVFYTITHSLCAFLRKSIQRGVIG